MAHTTFVPAPQTPKPAARPHHDHPRRTVLGWVLLAAAVVAAGVLLLTVAVSSPPQPAQAPVENGSLTNIPRDPALAEQWLAFHAGTTPQPGRYAGWPPGVPHSADAAERWFLRQDDAGVRVHGWPKGVAQSPDALDRWLAQQR